MDPLRRLTNATISESDDEDDSNDSYVPVASGGSDEEGTPQGGFLTQLDDKLDALEHQGRLSTPQLQEQFVGGGFEDGSTIALAPGCGLRQPLRDAVRILTRQWSEAFMALAYENQPASTFIVAQSSFRTGGYGSIPCNRAAGLQWLMRAIELGDLEAKAWARRVAKKELLEYLARKELTAKGKANITEDELVAAVEQWKIKDAEDEIEEARLKEEQEKELAGE